MNDKKNYKKGTRAEIVKLLYMCGIVPEKSLKYLNGKNYKVMRMKISEMIKEGTLKYVKRGNLQRVIALDEGGKEKSEYEKCLPPELVTYHDQYIKKDIKRFLYSGKKEKSLPGKDENTKIYVNDSEAHRVMYNSDTMIFMYGIGIETLSTIRSKNFPKLAYINAREIKHTIDYQADLDKKESEIKINYSRIRGMLVSEGGLYAVYRANTRATYLQNGEYKMKFYLDRIVQEKINETEELTQAILIADDNAKEIIKNILKPKEEETKYQFTSMEFVYKNIYGLPADKNGQKMLKIMTVKNWKEKMLKVFELPTRPEMDATIYDGYDGKKFYYVFCIPDIKKFKKFIARAEIEAKKENFVVLCFDWQVPLVSKVIGKYAVIKKVPFEKLIEMKFKE